jgi:maltose O-acetyltransferase
MGKRRGPWPTFGRDVVLNGILAWPAIPNSVRWRLLRSYGLDVARSSISPSVWFGSRRVTIGEGSFVNIGCLFSTHERITLGRNVFLAMRVTISTSTHEVGPAGKRAGALRTAPVTIGDGVWIGANATILPGVTIGEGTIVAAGSVVTSDCEPNSLYAGVPAVKKRDLA